MILDKIDRANLYTNVHERVTAALQFLGRKDLASLPIGRHEIRGDEIYALIQEYQSKDDKQVRWEAHRKYIDVQYVVSGAEHMGVADLGSLKITDAYDEKKEACFAAGPGDKVTLNPGSFIVLYPNDAHRPGIAIDKSIPVRKVVVKVAV